MFTVNCDKALEIMGNPQLMQIIQWAEYDRENTELLNNIIKRGNIPSLDQYTHRASVMDKLTNMIKIALMDGISQELITAALDIGYKREPREV